MKKPTFQNAVFCLRFLLCAMLGILAGCDTSPDDELGVNSRARAITMPPPPMPIRVPEESRAGKMIVMGSDGKPRLVESKMGEPQKTGDKSLLPGSYDVPGEFGPRRPFSPPNE